MLLVPICDSLVCRLQRMHICITDHAVPSHISLLLGGHCGSSAVHICPTQRTTATTHCLLQKLDQQLREEAQEEDKEYTGSLTVLIDITFELLRPYKDLRKTNLRDLSLTEAFWLLSGETEDSLKPGRRVQATIQGLSAMAAFCTLPDIRDMEAVISSSDISSSGEVRPDSRLRRGDTVPARSANQALSCCGSMHA